MGYRVTNLERLHCLPGSIEGIEHDRSQVTSTTETEPHPITKQQQPKVLYRGTLAECWAWVSSHQ